MARANRHYLPNQNPHVVEPRQRNRMMGRVLMCSLLWALMTAGREAAAGTGTETVTNPAELVAEAVQMTDAMSDNEMQARVLWRAAVVQARLGNQPAYAEAVRRMTDVSGNISEGYGRVIALINLADGQRRVGDVAGAGRTLDLALRAAGGESAGITLVARALAELGDRTAAGKAFALAIQMNGPMDEGFINLRFEGLFSIAEAQQAVKDVQGAEATLKIARGLLEGESDQADTVPYLRRIGAIQGMGDTAAGVASLQKTLVLTDSIKDQPVRTGERISTLIALAGVQYRAGDRSAATETLQRALHEINKLPNDTMLTAFQQHYRKDVKLSELVVAFARLGDLKRALEIQDRIVDRSYRNGVRLPLVEARLKAGDIKGAQTTATAIEKDDFIRKDSAFAQIANKQAEQADIKGALVSFKAVQTEPFKSVTLGNILGEEAKQGGVQTAVKRARSRTVPIERAMALAMIAMALTE